MMLKEKIEQLIKKYEDKKERHARLLCTPTIMYGDKKRKTYLDAAIAEYNFAREELLKIITQWNSNENIGKLQLAIIIQTEFNRYRDCPLAPDDKGKIEALFFIIEDFRKLVKETETKK